MPRFISMGGCLTALALFMAQPAIGQQIVLLDEDEETILQTLTVLAASEELRQALGVSNITAEDLARHPIGRDLAEIIRTMPGVNLTGNTSTGQRGNQRQIDIRGMGPENTMILIDGKPVMSRNSVRPGRWGDRDSRGDANWVPPELIERIEVIRGPAAARYGSGAAGGVINIITKQPTRQTMTVSTYMLVPESADEGGTQRANITLGGPINDIFSYRLTAGASFTQPDSPEINDDATGTNTAPAGREGVVSYDARGLWSAQINADHRLDLEAAWSRQGNRFAGDTLLGSSGAPGTILDQLAQAGAETNVLERTTLSLSHIGTYEFGRSNSYIQWENTYNRRLTEGTAGGSEGAINSDANYRVNIMDNLSAKSEWDIPLFALWNQTVTLGAEYRGEFLQSSTELANGTVTPFEGGVMQTHIIGLYAEDNIVVTDQFTLTPGLRLDWHDHFGLNLSPSLNASYELTDEITIRAGIARAFKAPNIYQLNPDYYWTTMGMGCPAGVATPCYVTGNPNLDAEISINSEIGVSYANQDGWQASLTYFHNEFENRIEASNPRPLVTGGTLMQWENMGPATVSGLEGNLVVPLLDTLTWSTNFTKMIESRDHRTNQPLSLIPEYTINTSLRWQALDELGLTLSATHFGKINPRTQTNLGAPIAPADQVARDPYTTVNFALDYELNEGMKLSAGVNNLINTRQFRTNEGANTFNEPGRSYYVSLTGSF